MLYSLLPVRFLKERKTYFWFNLFFKLTTLTGSSSRGSAKTQRSNSKCCSQRSKERPLAVGVYVYRRRCFGLERKWRGGVGICQTSNRWGLLRRNASFFASPCWRVCHSSPHRFGGVRKSTFDDSRRYEKETLQFYSGSFKCDSFWTEIWSH